VFSPKKTYNLATEQRGAQTLVLRIHDVVLLRSISTTIKQKMWLSATVITV